MQTVGGEIRNPKRSLLFGLVLAEIVSVVVWLGLTYVLDSVVGISFIEAWTLTVGAGSSTVPTVVRRSVRSEPSLAMVDRGGTVSW